jgi:hypothetical protein
MGNTGRENADAAAYAEASKRLEAQREKERAYLALKNADDDYVPRTRQSGGVAAGPTPSTRNHADAAEFMETPEVLTPLNKFRATGMTSAHTFNTNVRDRMRAQQAAEEFKNSPEGRQSAATEMYLASQKRNEQLVAEGIARRAKEQQQQEQAQLELEQRNAEIIRTNKRIIEIKIELNSWNASPAERNKVWARFARQPEMGAAAVGTMIVAMREMTGGEPPVWKF